VQQAAQAESCEASVAEGYGNRRKQETARQQRRRRMRKSQAGGTTLGSTEGRNAG
jgi:hypothetical protein